MIGLAHFTEPARHAVIRAGLLTHGHTLGTGPLLHALLEDGPVAGVDITPDFVRRPDRDLLATLGIDLDDVHRRAAEATSLRRDDPSLWRLRRSPWRPLRVTLTGPGTHLILNEAARKTMEVALWAARRRAYALQHPEGVRARRPELWEIVPHRQRPVTREDLLWGLLADHTNKAVRLLRSRNVDLERTWTTLKLA
jgi:hypothetical protein